MEADIQGPQRLFLHYFNPSSTSIMVPGYPDSIIFVHALKVANPLGGCLLIVFGKTMHEADCRPWHNTGIST